MFEFPKKQCGQNHRARQGKTELVQEKKNRRNPNPTNKFNFSNQILDKVLSH